MKLSPAQVGTLMFLTKTQTESSNSIQWSQIQSSFPEFHIIQLQQTYLREMYKIQYKKQRFHTWDKISVRLLAEAVKYYGRDWSTISDKMFFWINPSSLKNKYFVLLGRGDVDKVFDEVNDEVNCPITDQQVIDILSKVLYTE